MELSLSNLSGIVWRRLSKKEFAEHRSMGRFYTKRIRTGTGTGTGDKTEGKQIRFCMYVSREKGDKRFLHLEFFPNNTYTFIFILNCCKAKKH